MINKLYLLLITLFLSSYFYSIVEEDPLPTLGDYSSASISLSGEYELGRLWLAMYRGSTKEHSDPLMRTYLEDLIYLSYFGHDYILLYYFYLSNYDL